jgi:hypothetical protein
VTPSYEQKINMSKKLIEDMTKSDFTAYPVWVFINDDEEGRMALKPVKKMPAKNLDGKIVGCQVQFANGTSHTAMLGEIDVDNPKRTEQFITLSVEKDGKWFQLSRYFDHDFRKNGPDGLAGFMGLKTDEVFPVSYDIRKFTGGKADALRGTFSEVPPVIMARQERMDLAAP